MSKSVKLRKRPARTGTTKKIARRTSAGARKIQPASSSGARQRGSRGMQARVVPVMLEEPSPLLEDAVHIAVEPDEHGLGRGAPPDGELGPFLDARRDLFPFRNLRRRDHAGELLAERTEL